MEYIENLSPFMLELLHCEKGLFYGLKFSFSF